MSGRAVFVRQLGFLTGIIAFAMVGFGCATATDKEEIGSVDAALSPPDASSSWADAPTSSFPDAHVATYPDANTSLPDAYVPSTPDAGGSGLFCSANAECTTPGECCFFLIEPPGFCVVGEIILDVCFPSE